MRQLLLTCLPQLQLIKCALMVSTGVCLRCLSLFSTCTMFYLWCCTLEPENSLREFPWGINKVSLFILPSICLSQVCTHNMQIPHTKALSQMSYASGWRIRQKFSWSSSQCESLSLLLQLSTCVHAGQGPSGLPLRAPWWPTQASSAPLMRLTQWPWMQHEVFGDFSISEWL